VTTATDTDIQQMLPSTADWPSMSSDPSLYIPAQSLTETPIHIYQAPAGKWLDKTAKLATAYAGEISQLRRSKSLEYSAEFHRLSRSDQEQDFDPFRSHLLRVFLALERSEERPELAEIGIFACAHQIFAVEAQLEFVDLDWIDDEAPDWLYEMNHTK